MKTPTILLALAAALTFSFTGCASHDEMGHSDGTMQKRTKSGSPGMKTVPDQTRQY